MTNDQRKLMLDIEFESIDFNYKLTIRDYLKKLLKTLWKEGAGFSGKRPFGNGDWQDDIYRSLIGHGLIPGELDEDGCIEEFDEKTAEKLVLELIDEL